MGVFLYKVCHAGAIQVKSVCHWRHTKCDTHKQQNGLL